MFFSFRRTHDVRRRLKRVLPLLLAGAAITNAIMANLDF
jgi:hypothetical protein